MPPHLREWWVAGAFFAGISAAEFCLGFLALSVASRRLWLLAVSLSIASREAIIVTRATGLADALVTQTRPSLMAFVIVAAGAVAYKMWRPAETT